MSQDYQIAPSKLLKLKRSLKRDNVFDPELQCWFFDTAVRWFGHHVEAEVTKADDPQQALEALLQTTEKISAEDAAALLRMKLNAALGRSPLSGMRE